MTSWPRSWPGRRQGAGSSPPCPSRRRPFGCWSPVRAPHSPPAPLPVSPPPDPAPSCSNGLLSAAATLGLSARGQGPGLGLPSTRGAPAPTPRTSLGSPVSSGPVHMSPLEPRAGRLDGLALGRSGGQEAGLQPEGALTALSLRPLLPQCSSWPAPWPAWPPWLWLLSAGAGEPAVGRWGAGGGAAGRWGAVPRGLSPAPLPRFQRDIRLTQKTDYAAPQATSSPTTPRISVRGPAHPARCPAPPNPPPWPDPPSCPLTPPPQPGDQRLAHSAEVYHYQHQRQQMRCLDR